MTIQEKAKKLLKVLSPKGDYRYQIAEIVARTQTDSLRNNSVAIVERAWKIYFGSERNSHDT